MRWVWTRAAPSGSPGWLPTLQCAQAHNAGGSMRVVVRNTADEPAFKVKLDFRLLRARCEALGQSIVSTRYCQAEPAGGPPLMGPRRGGRSAQAVAQDAAVGKGMFCIGIMNFQWRAARVSGCYGLSSLPEEGTWLCTRPLLLSILSRFPQAHLPGRHPQRGNYCARRSWWDW